MVLVHPLLQLLRLGAVEVVVAQGDAEALVELGEQPLELLGGNGRRRHDVDVRQVTRRGDAMHLEGVDGHAGLLVLEGHLLPGQEPRVLEDPLAVLVGPDLGQAVVVDDEGAGVVSQGAGALGEDGGVVGAHAQGQVPGGQLQDLQGVPLGAVVVVVLVPPLHWRRTHWRRRANLSISVCPGATTSSRRYFSRRWRMRGWCGSA